MTMQWMIAAAAALVVPAIASAQMPSHPTRTPMIDALLADREKLASILTYHVVAGKVMAGDIVKASGATPTTVNGLPLDIAVRDGKVYVNGAQVVSADIAASNGVIHVIDTVLLPTTAPAGAGR
jgi:uncharacterized surface protein with fasciclin (FAS1) repeats